jgi:hypothetical protein
MSWLDNRKQDVEAAIVGGLIGWEAHKQDIEEIDWETTLDFVAEQGIEVNRAREFILNKAVDLGFIVRDQLS